MKKKPPGAKFVLKEFLKRGISSPTEMARLYELNYGRRITPTAFTVALRRLENSAKEKGQDSTLQHLVRPSRLCSCGRDISLFPKDFRNCPYCGGEIATLKCPKCGKDLTDFPNEIIYCPFCGEIVSVFLKRKASSLGFPNVSHSRYTEEDDTAIMELHRAGKPNKQIADTFGRTTQAIRSRINILSKKM